MEFGSVSFCYIKTMETIFEKDHARVTCLKLACSQASLKHTRNSRMSVSS